MFDVRGEYAMDTTKVKRRQVRYQSLQELLDDASKQATSQVATSGNWSQGQIFEHLARNIDRSIDGYSHRVALPFRLLGRFIFKKKILRNGMSPGFQLPRKAADELVPTPCEAAAALEHLRRAVARLQTDSNRVSHPFFGKMTLAEWEQLHLKHAELHMSFIGV
jgi:hypothetical protein